MANKLNTKKTTKPTVRNFRKEKTVSFKESISKITIPPLPRTFHQNLVIEWFAKWN